MTKAKIFQNNRISIFEDPEEVFNVTGITMDEGTREYSFCYQVGSFVNRTTVRTFFRGEIEAAHDALLKAIAKHRSEKGIQSLQAVGESSQPNESVVVPESHNYIQLQVGGVKTHTLRVTGILLVSPSLALSNSLNVTYDNGQVVSLTFDTNLLCLNAASTLSEILLVN